VYTTFFSIFQFLNILGTRINVTENTPAGKLQDMGALNAFPSICTSMVYEFLAHCSSGCISIPLGNSCGFVLRKLISLHRFKFAMYQF
jgi:hypothetical protein